MLLFLAACTAPVPTAWIEPGVREAVRADGSYDTLVVLDDGADVNAAIACGRAEVVRRYDNFAVVQLRVDEPALDRLAACPGVQGLTLHHTFRHQLTESIPL